MITVFLNPSSGVTAEDRRAVVADLFTAASAPVRFVTLGPDIDTAAEVRTAVASGTRVVVAAGGDGTVSSVASSLVGTAIPFGVLPLGTLNHFAKDIGVPLDLPLAVRAIVDAHTARVDVGEVNGRPFLNNSSIGLYPDLVIERERLRRRGHRKWVAAAIAAAGVLRHYRGILVRLKSAEATQRTRTPFMFVGNNEYETEGLRLGARRRVDCGKLFGYLAPRVQTRDLPRLLALALLGRTRTSEKLTSFAATELEVDTPGRHHVRVALDGEVRVLATPLRYRVRPLALSVIVPAH